LSSAFNDTSIPAYAFTLHRFLVFLLAYSMLLRVQLNVVSFFSLQKRTRFVTVPDEIIG
jgi:hypothetical protein